MAARHEQEFFVLGLGGVVHEVLEGVGARLRDLSRNALLVHHARVVRESLARYLAGVGHAYPSPIVLPLRSPGAHKTNERGCRATRRSAYAPCDNQ
ncbi:hypothetical protein [Streptomyces sp. CS62]|uniref:hypothetical protein n=1 Tax=Streptomyces sp. CS62 TaxID=3119268 RepID=UPI002F92787E